MNLRRFESFSYSRDRKKELKKELVWSKYRDSKTYTTVVWSVVYVGFFYAWSGVNSQLPFEEKIWSLLWMIVSILVFITWEIFKMLFFAFSIRKKQKVLGAKNTIIKLEQLLNEIDNKYKPMCTRLWIFVLIFTIVPALISISYFLTGLFKIIA